ARCQSEAEADIAEAVEGGGELGIVGEEAQDFGSGNFDSAPGVETLFLFPKNSAKLVSAGEETELLVGVENVGESPVNVIAISASVHLPFDHRMLVQNLSAQFSHSCSNWSMRNYSAVPLVSTVAAYAFNNASIPPSKQATFPYIFAVSKYLQVNGYFKSLCTIRLELYMCSLCWFNLEPEPGTFDLVGNIFYEIDQHPYQSTFYNGTIEVVEAGGFLSVESVFLVTLGIALLVLF
ncbi:hypothetical protein Goari_024750, partial [Gossypium aridum]|nr:hypothetical protein [Gossypium aridum]